LDADRATALDASVQRFLAARGEAHWQRFRAAWDGLGAS
jgi:hypothetical protein